MKEVNKTGLIAVSIIGIFIFFSCSNQTSPAKERTSTCSQAQTFSSDFCNLKFHLKEVDSTYGNCNVGCAQLLFHYPYFESPKNDSFYIGINKEINKKLTHSYTAEEGLDDFFNNYLDLTKKFPDYHSTWQLKSEAEVLELNPRFMTVKVESYSFTGGAHGLEEMHYINADLKNREIFNLDDLLDTTNIEDIRKDITFALKEQNSYATDSLMENLGFFYNEGNFPLPTEFYISGTHIHFLYNQYEVAPYSFGILRAKLPLEQFKNQLQEKYTEN